MSQKNLSLTAGVIFFLIAVLHLLRVLNSWEAVIGGWMVPMWLSWATILIAGFLSYQSFKLAKG